MEFSELLFYSGIAISAASLLLALVAFVIFKGKRRHLDAKLDQEYGKKEGGHAPSQ